jgi:hypothetical protein
MRMRFIGWYFRMKQLFRNNGLSFVLIGLFALFLVGQILAGRLDYINTGLQVCPVKWKSVRLSSAAGLSAAGSSRSPGTATST